MHNVRNIPPINQGWAITIILLCYVGSFEGVREAINGKDEPRSCGLITSDFCKNKLKYVQTRYSLIADLFFFFGQG